MSAQEGELKKNHIGILCEATVEPGTLALPKSDRLLKDYLLNLLRRRVAARPTVSRAEDQPRSSLFPIAWKARLFGTIILVL